MDRLRQFQKRVGVSTTSSMSTTSTTNEPLLCKQYNTKKNHKQT